MTYKKGVIEDMTVMDKFLKWYNYPQLNEELKKDLENIKNNPEEIAERFYKDLEFGTGGLRGILGAGTNRMNIYTVSKASQGLANYINKTLPATKEKKVVIAFDSRHKSREFAIQAGLVLAKNNIKAYVFQDITPTPLLSYAVCQLQATAGIVITASHNPKEYNGYKVYWSHGGQITDFCATEIINEVNNITEELRIEALALDDALELELFTWLEDDILNSYLNRTKGLMLNPHLVATEGHSLKIVYTPLHGTGCIPVTRLLKESGFTNLQVVKEQSIADPDFSTVVYPNPEEEAAFELALDLGEKINADIIMGTDPDADRIGVIAKDADGKYVLLTGNQLGALLIDYLIETKSKNNSLPINGIIIKTIVTSNMGVEIAAKHGIGYLDVLTGFKYIGEKIAEFAESREHSFLFGYEESYGFLIGDYVRDKDAVQIALIVAEMALYYKQNGLSLHGRLEKLFELYGYYQEDLINITLSGIEGQKKILDIMDYFRREKPQTLGQEKIILIKDYLLTEETNLPQSNVLHYTLKDNSWVCIRPSGTEPKLKVYLGVKEDNSTQAKQKIAQLRKDVLKIIEEI